MIWIENPSVLFDYKRLKHYFPGPNLTWEEQANSLMRFIIYLSLILYLYYNNAMMVIVPPLMMGATQYHLHREGKLQKLLTKIFGGTNAVDDELSHTMIEETTGDDLVISHMEKVNNANYPDVKPNGPPNGQPNGMSDDPLDSPAPLKEPENTGDTKEGFDMHKYRHITNAFDWDPKTGEPKETVGPRPDMSLVRDEPGYFPKEIECKLSTTENPFGNALPYDSIERQVNKVCPDEFKKDENFYSGLFNSVDDLFDRNNSQRQFTTNPSSTRVNDREAAIQFFYNTPYTEH